MKSNGRATEIMNLYKYSGTGEVENPLFPGSIDREILIKDITEEVLKRISKD